MDLVTVLALAVSLGVSLGGMVGLCVALQQRNRWMARRELFGLPVGDSYWP